MSPSSDVLIMSPVPELLSYHRVLPTCRLGYIRPRDGRCFIYTARHTYPILGMGATALPHSSRDSASQQASLDFEICIYERAVLLLINSLAQNTRTGRLAPSQVSNSTCVISDCSVLYSLRRLLNASQHNAGKGSSYHIAQYCVVSLSAFERSRKRQQAEHSHGVLAQVAT